MRSFKHPRPADITLEGILAALGDPIRLALVHRLSGGCGASMNCKILAEKVDSLAPSTRSHHLRILREAGLIQSERKGVEVLNSLRSTEIDKRFPGLLKSILSQRP